MKYIEFATVAFILAIPAANAGPMDWGIPGAIPGQGVGHYGKIDLGPSKAAADAARKKMALEKQQIKARRGTLERNKPKPNN